MSQFDTGDFFKSENGLFQPLQLPVDKKKMLVGSHFRVDLLHFERKE